MTAPQTDKDTPQAVVEQVTAETVPAPADNRAEVAPIEQASEQALMPGVPGRDEFLSLAMQARILSLSGAAPKAVRGNPYVAFHVAMVGRDLGISPSAALELIDVLDTQAGPRLSLSPQLLNGQIRRLGLGSIVPAVQTDERCVAVALAPGGRLDRKCAPTYPNHREGCDCAGIIGDTEFTWEDARTAGLVGRDCQPGNHSPACGNKQSVSSLRCAQGYKTYPKRLLWWRSGGYCADDYFPEAGLGLYSPEELGAVVDVDGRPIDPSTVDLPDGYQPEPDPEPDLLSDEQRRQVQVRIQALPPPAVELLREAWSKPKTDEDGEIVGRFLPPLAHCEQKHMAKINALVGSFEQRAAKGEWADAQPEGDGEPEPQVEGEGGDGKTACALCGSTRAGLVIHEGVTRCANAAGCAKRVETEMSQLDGKLAMLRHVDRLGEWQERAVAAGLSHERMGEHAAREQAVALAEEVLAGDGGQLPLGGGA